MKKRSDYLDLILLLLTLSLAFVPLAVEAPQIRHITTIVLLYISLSLTWNLIAHSGLFSFAHAVFFGIGAYASVLMSNAGLPPVYGFLIGVLLSFIVALMIGFISIRLGGIYFSIFTLVLLLLMSQLPFHLDF